MLDKKAEKQVTTHWGILATGGIAGSMASALTNTTGAKIVAVGSRTKVSADRFGKRWGIPRRYGSYEGVVTDPNVDIVYIATPHSLHYENMLMGLNAGKHLLCEKPLTLNAPQAQICVNLARQKGLFLMEAVWMRFFPAMAQVREWVANGVIGDIRLVQADFCFQLPYDPHHRLYDPALGGGALLDLGIYPLSFTTMLLGFPKQVEGIAQLSQTGVDELDSLTLNYGKKTTAQLSCSMAIYKPREAFVVGSKGYIKVHDTFFCPHKLTLGINGQAEKVVELPFKGNGLEHEVEAVNECLNAGMIEHPLMPLDETVQMMALMDKLRADWGITYPKK